MRADLNRSADDKVGARGELLAGGAARSSSALEVVPEGVELDKVVGRWRAADAAESCTFDVFELAAEHEPAVRALEDVPPIAALNVHEALVISDACRRRAGGAAVNRRCHAATVVKNGSAVAERAKVARVILLDAGIGIECQSLPRIKLYPRPGMDRSERDERAVGSNRRVGQPPR